MGTIAGYYVANNASRNTCIGRGAGNRNTGNDNMYLGNEAAGNLRDNCDQNVMIGSFKDCKNSSTSISLIPS